MCAVWGGVGGGGGAGGGRGEGGFVEGHGGILDWFQYSIDRFEEVPKTA